LVRVSVFAAVLVEVEVSLAVVSVKVSITILLLADGLEVLVAYLVGE